MKISKYILGICLGGMFSLTSCYDLEQLPNDSVIVDFNDATKAYEGLVGVYQSLNESGTYKGRYSLESCTDLGWSNNGWWSTYDHYNISTGIANIWYGGFKEEWQGHYRGVQRANNLIKNMKASALDEAIKKQYIAEAKFVRALMYFNLMNFYGGVPIYDETFEGSGNEMLLPRNSEEEVREFIIKDLTDCIENLPKISEAVGRAGQGAAYALRGKVYLFNKEYEKAKVDFLQVVNGGYGYVLNSSFPDLFRPSGYEQGADDCNEIIFAVEHMGGSATPYGFSVQFLGNRASYGGCINTNVASQQLIDMYDCIDGKPYNRDDFFAGISDEDLYLSVFDATGSKVVQYPLQLEKLKAMYAQRDPRLGYTVILPYSMYKGWANNEATDCEMVLSKDSVKVNGVWTGEYARSYHSYEGNGYVRNAYGQDTYMWRKFVQEYDWGGQITDRGNSPVNWPIIRYADVLLMLAECYNQTGDQTNAVNYINMVRARVGMPGLNSGPAWLAATSQDEVFARIKKERACELALEGKRWFDLKRWGDLVSATNGMQETDIMGTLVGAVKNIDSKYNTWPIPGSEIDSNPDLTQNIGW